MTQHSPKPIPEKYRDLATAPLIAALATTLSNGTPQVTPVWFSYTDGYFYVNTAAGRVKEKAMKKNPYVALLIMDPKSVYRYLAVRGPIVEASEAEGWAHIHALSRHYGGKDFTPNHPDEVRIRYKISPEFVDGHG
jgi:PPOX class probable F420-dependent enzyme